MTESTWSVLWTRIPTDELVTWLTDAIPSEALLAYQPYAHAPDAVMADAVMLYRGVRRGSILLPEVSSWTGTHDEAALWGNVFSMVIPSRQIVAHVLHHDTGTHEYIVRRGA